MQLLLHFITLMCMLTCSALSAFGQEKALGNFTLRIGAGNSISIRHFTKEATSLNIPGSSFVHVQLSTQLNQKQHTSLFLGADMQTLNYYPTFNEKATLTFLSLLAGRTSRVDVTPGLQVKLTGGLSLGSLVDVSSSVTGSGSYSGSPAKNLNIGLFNNLQVLLGGEKEDDRFGYGLGFDVVVNGVPVYSDSSYPTYLQRNAFIQYGLSFILNYTFKARSANR